MLEILKLKWWRYNPEKPVWHIECQFVMEKRNFFYQEFCLEDLLSDGSVDIADIAGVFVMLAVGSLVGIAAVIYEYFFYKYYRGSQIEARFNDMFEQFEGLVRAGVEIYEKIVSFIYWILSFGRVKKFDNKPEVIEKLDIENK